MKYLGIEGFFRVTDLRTFVAARLQGRGGAAVTEEKKWDSYQYREIGEGGGIVKFQRKA